MPFPSHAVVLQRLVDAEIVTSGPDPNTGQVEARCPAHDDANASLSLGVGADGKKAVIDCHAGCTAHDVVSALGVGARTRKFVRSPGKTSSSRPRAKPATSTLTPITNQGDPAAWHRRLMNSPAARIAFMTDKRGLTIETLDRYQIGWDGKRYTIPVEVDCAWVNVRRYIRNPPPEVDKMLNISGHGTAVLYPEAVLRAEGDLPVLLCEGELDALLANQEAQGQFIAVTGTGGADTVPKDLSALAGREVFVVYDCDDAGQKGALEIANALAGIASLVRVLDLTRLGLEPGSKQDVTDLFLTRDDAASAVGEEMGRLRDEPDEGPDEVLRDIQQMFLVADDSALDHLADGLTDDEIAALEPPRFAVDGWLPRGYFSVLYGAPGVMKTFVIVDILRHVRAGMTWHSHATERGAVLLYEGEGLAQIQARIAAWDERYPEADLAPGWSFERFVDITQPEGVAAMVRTVRGYEARKGTQVSLIAIDPLVEFMTGDENGEGTQQASRGLRALAQYLGIAVLVGHHSNALGERARGTDHLKMRAGAHIRVERTDDGAVALVQEKQKNAAPQAIVLHPTPFGTSLVLETGWSVPAANYVAQKANQAHASRAEANLERSRVSRDMKEERARGLLLDSVRAKPGMAQSALLRHAKSHGIGHDLLAESLKTLIEEGAVRVEPGPNRSRLHYPGEE